MTFAALQSRVNAAVAAKVATDAATLNGVAVTGKFANEYAEQFGMSGSSPTFTLSDAAAAAPALGTAVVVNAVSYTVAGIQPDGSGMTRLLLQEV